MINKGKKWAAKVLYSEKTKDTEKFCNLPAKLRAGWELPGTGGKQEKPLPGRQGDQTCGKTTA
jgi:hypothetical protein